MNTAVPGEPSHEQTTWGVGPWIGELPTEDFSDPELLREGDTRNVLDKYRYWKMEAIVADLNTKRHKLQIAIENWQHDLKTWPHPLYNHLNPTLWPFECSVTNAPGCSAETYQCGIFF